MTDPPAAALLEVLATETTGSWTPALLTLLTAM